MPDDKLNVLDYPVCFSRPLRIRASGWLQHVPFGMFLVDFARPDTIVELGTFHGVSYCAFCQAVKELMLPTRCYAVDTWQGDDHAGPLEPTALADLRKHHDQRYGSFSQLIQSTFDAALASFPDQSIDLLHIDGFHTYEAVRHDFNTWLPKMSKRGLILLHDIAVRDRGFGVWKLWEDLKPQFPHFEFMHGNGLGLVVVGSEARAGLGLLTDADRQSVASLQKCFEQLGSGIEAVQELEACRQESLEEQERLRNSRTFKAGRIVTSPLRFVRSLVR